MNKSVQVWTIKDNYRLGSDISSKVLALAFSLSAEIERNLISQRTKEAMARIKAQGNHVGRPHGAKSSELKLTGKDEQIREMLTQRVSKTRIAETLGVDRSTLKRFLGNGESLFSAPLC